MNKTLYTDCCYDIDTLEKETNLKIILRNNEKWDIGYLANILTSPELEMVVINNINEQSIMEMAIALFMCKTIIITCKAIDEYLVLKEMATYICRDCSLTNAEGSENFYSWYNEGKK